MATFKFTKNHLKLIRRMYVGWQHCEAGAPKIDPKRPYGNSDVARDVAEIIGLKFNEDDGLTDAQESKCLKLHEETERALQVFLQHATLTEGMFKEAGDYSNEWKKTRSSRSKSL